MRFAIAGAGPTGAVIARELAEAGHRVDVFEQRDHLAGNCHTERDADTGVLVHRYGPHIFHTDLEDVWGYVNRFAEMVPYRHTVRAAVGGQVYSLPLNLLTISHVYGRALTPSEARELIAGEVVSCEQPETFEQQALALVGRRLYDLFLSGYTAKQWGVNPARLPAAIARRLPVRFTHDDSYFTHPHVAIPRDGYTAMIERIVDHPNITVRLSTPFLSGLAGWDHVVWTGPLDAWFGHRFGRLGYRTLGFEAERHTGDHQGCAQMNYPDRDVPFTRITEHKHLAPWEQHDDTVIYREYSRQAGPGDEPYYPIRLADDRRLLDAYFTAARAERNVTFAGRLGTYRYLDMDRAIGEALAVAGQILEAVVAGSPPPVFGVDPT